MKNNNVRKMIISALFMAISFVLPFLTGQIPEIGSKLCPMHIPLFLCGFVCGWPWGLAAGFIAPILRSLIFSMPPLYPTAVCMAFKLAVSAFLSGLLYRVFPKKRIYTYLALIIAIISGRLVWGVAMLACMGITGVPFTFSAFITGAFINAIPAIIIQIIAIPLLVALFEKFKFIKKQ